MSGGDLLFEKIGAPATARVLRLLAATLKSKWRADEDRLRFQTVMAEARPVIFAFWHEDLFGIAALHMKENWRRAGADKPVAVMVSRSRDGERLAGVIGRMGAMPVRGSSSKGGMRGMIELERWLKAEPRRFAALALDGPRGPRREVKPGVAMLARRTGALVAPVSFNFSKQWEFGSWDRTKLAKPWAAMECSMGELLESGSMADAELVIQIQKNLMK